MQPRSLILITVDCLRADHVGFLGYARRTTPFLDCLADESMVFQNAIVAGAPTYYSVPSILTSRYPLALGRDVLGIAPEETTIASVLQESGFATAGFSAANPYISPRFGYDRGFDVFADFLQDSSNVSEDRARGTMHNRANRLLASACHSTGLLGSIYDELYFRYCQKIASRRVVSFDSERKFPSADVLVDCALSWLQEHSDQQFFLWLHFMDAHGPYFPKAEALELMGERIDTRQAVYLNSYWNRGDVAPERLRDKREAVTSLYDAGIRWVDEQVRRLAERLVDLNLWDNCAIALTADHGEEFLEHGGRYHQPRKLTEELVRVPLLLRVPRTSASKVDAVVSLIDVAPTLLDVVGVPMPVDFRGRSLSSETGAGQSQGRPVITECIRGCDNPFYSPDRLGPRLLSVRRNNYKLVLDLSAASEELFDLAQDCGERNPLPAGEVREVRHELLQDARKHLVESSQSRDFDRRIASQVRDFRLELARPAAHIREN